jgi:hypothetical protein
MCTYLTRTAIEWRYSQVTGKAQMELKLIPTDTADMTDESVRSRRNALRRVGVRRDQWWIPATKPS